MSEIEVFDYYKDSIGKPIEIYIPKYKINPKTYSIEWEIILSKLCDITYNTEHDITIFKDYYGYEFTYNEIIRGLVTGLY